MEQNKVTASTITVLSMSTEASACETNETSLYQTFLRAVLFIN